MGCDIRDYVIRDRDRRLAQVEPDVDRSAPVDREAIDCARLDIRNSDYCLTTACGDNRSLCPFTL